MRHFFLFFEQSAPISTSPDLRSAAFAPALLVLDRRAQASAAPLLRCKFSIFSFSFTAVVWRCPGLPLICRAAFLRQDALASAKMQCTHPSLSCSLSYPQVLRDAARPAVRTPTAPCCRQTGVCLDSRGGCPKYKARSARRAFCLPCLSIYCQHSTPCRNMPVVQTSISVITYLCLFLLTRCSFQRFELQKYSIHRYNKKMTSIQRLCLS